MHPPENLFQPYGKTREDRYPFIFQKITGMIKDSPELFLLSFGCSTGEEVYALRKYFAQSRILGLDINHQSIRECQKRQSKNPDAAIEFAVKSTTSDYPAHSFDAVFAMAVFRHGGLNQRPFPEKCDHLIRFEDFERAMVDFTRCLKVGGVLVLRHAMFRFMDTCIADQFMTALRIEKSLSGPLYGRENQLIAETQPFEVVFRKIR